jgi:hypothetical protein
LLLNLIKVTREIAAGAIVQVISNKALFCLYGTFQVSTNIKLNVRKYEAANISLSAILNFTDVIHMRNMKIKPN